MSIVIRYCPLRRSPFLMIAALSYIFLQSPLVSVTYGQEEEHHDEHEAEHAAERADEQLAHRLDHQRIRRFAKLRHQTGHGDSHGDHAHAGGDFVDNLRTSIDSTYAHFTDGNIGASGNDSEVAVYVSGSVGDHMQLALGVNQSRYKTNGVTGVEHNTTSAEALMNYSISDNLSLGAFVSYSSIDLESANFGAGTAKRQIDRWGTGIFAGASHAFDETELSITMLLAGNNARALDKTLNDRRVSWLTMLAVHQKLTDHLAAEASATYTNLIENESPLDGSYWTFGAELDYHLSDRVSVMVGFEKTVEFRRFQEDRGVASVTFSF